MLDSKYDSVSRLVGNFLGFFIRYCWSAKAIILHASSIYNSSSWLLALKSICLAVFIAFSLVKFSNAWSVLFWVRWLILSKIWSSVRLESLALLSWNCICAVVIGNIACHKICVLDCCVDFQGIWLFVSGHYWLQIILFGL